MQFYTLTPCRLVDTRGADGALGGPALEAAGGPDRSFALTGTCGIPPEATSVSVNLTVRERAGRRHAFRSTGATAPSLGRARSASPPGSTRANNAVLQLATDGSGTIKVNNTAPGPVHFILDVNGYFE